MEVANFPTLTASVNADTTNTSEAKTELNSTPDPIKQVFDTKLVLPDQPILLHNINTPNMPTYCRECQNQNGICQLASTNNNKLGYLQLQIGGFTIKALVDTGASISVMSQELLNKIATCDPDNVITTRQPKTNTTVTLADGQTVPILEVARIQFKIFDENLDELFYILKETHSTILGWPFFANNDLTIDCKRRLLIRENCTFQINTITARQKTKPTRTTLDL